MSAKQKAILIILCAAMLLALPLLAPYGAMLGDVKMELLDEMWADEEAGLFTLLLPSARAEESDGQEKDYSLPIDFTPGMEPNPAGYTENGYQDDSITVTLEHREEDGVSWRIAYVTIKDASQLRTATAGKLTSSRTALTSSMAKDNNAVIAINGDYFSNNPAKTSFEYRMGQKIRNKSNKLKDILIIDELGDFHLFIKSDKAKMTAFNESGRKIINAFTFGPALVVDGELQTMDKEYGYNPNGDEPRMAIGQMDALSYVLVLAEGRINGSEGVTHQELADFAYALGCKQAYNLDGGNSATMVINGEYFQTKSASNERALSDIIYFASAVDSKEWK